MNPFRNPATVIRNQRLYALIDEIWYPQQRLITKKGYPWVGIGTRWWTRTLSSLKEERMRIIGVINSLAETESINYCVNYE